MTKREKKLLVVLLIVILFCGFYFSFSYCLDKIANTELRINKYETAIARLNNTESLNTQPVTNSVVVYPEISINQAVQDFLSTLEKNGITTSRYQISSESSTPSADISFSCSSYSLMNYLYKEYSNPHNYHVTYLHVTQNNEDVSVNIHIENLPTEPTLTLSDYTIEPDSVRKLFYTPVIQKSIEPAITEDISEPTILKGNYLFEVIGNINTGDMKYLYLKNKATNSVIKVSQHEILSEDEDSLIILLEGEKYEITK